MDPWDHLRFFLAAHREGTFTGAARALGVEQSTASRRVAAFEEVLGGALFDRTPEGLLPTPLAQHILEHAEAVERHVHGLMTYADGFAAKAAGEVRLAVTETMATSLVVPALPAFRKAHPEVLLDVVTGLQVADLTRRQADVALRMVRPQGEELVAKRVAQLPLAVVCRRDLLPTRNTRQKKLAADDLPWVTVSLDDVDTPEEQWFRAHVNQLPALRTNSYLAQLVAVQQGVGAALMVEALARTQDDLVVVDLDVTPDVALDVWLVTHKALRRVPRVQAVWDFCEQLFDDVSGPAAKRKRAR